MINLIFTPRRYSFLILSPLWLLRSFLLSLWVTLQQGWILQKAPQVMLFQGSIWKMTVLTKPHFTNCWSSSNMSQRFRSIVLSLKYWFTLSQFLSCDYLSTSFQYWKVTMRMEDSVSSCQIANRVQKKMIQTYRLLSVEVLVRLAACSWIGRLGNRIPVEFWPQMIFNWLVEM